MKLTEAIAKARTHKHDGAVATVTVDEPWQAEVATLNDKHVLTHSPGLVSLDYLSQHVETARAIKAVK